jgi:hypothetical protein
LASENEESCLKDIFGVLVRQQSATDTPDQPAMTLEQTTKRHFVAVAEETLEELRVGEFTGRLRIDQLVQVAKQGGLSVGHEVVSPEKGLPLALQQSLRSNWGFFALKGPQNPAWGNAPGTNVKQEI